MPDHRAERILATLEASLQAIDLTGLEVVRGEPNAQPVDTPRRIVLTHGDDDPVSEFGAANMANIDSLLSVVINLGVRGPTGKWVEQRLIDLRRETHIKLMADQQQGLEFVHDTRYGGAGEPETSIDGSERIGTMRTLWIIYYRMDIADPSV